MTHESETALSGTHPERQMLNGEDLDTIETIARNGQTGRITPYEVRELLRGYRAYLASQGAAAPSEEPVAWQWRALENGEPATAWKDLERGDRMGWLAIANRRPDKYAVETRPLFASPAVAPVAVSVKGLIERLWPNGLGPKDIEEIAIFIEEERKCEAEYRALMIPRRDVIDALNEALGLAKLAAELTGCRGDDDYVASVQAKIEAILYSSIIPATKGGEDRATRFLAWACNTFTADVATNTAERLMRFAEEAIELAMACDMPKATMDKIIARVYGRDPGNIKQETAQCQVTLELLAKVLGVDLDVAADEEFSRVQAIPQAEWDRRHAAKVAIGIATGAALSAQDTDGVAKP